jgi:membrane fusion protein, copper/silver efflux system
MQRAYLRPVTIGAVLLAAGAAWKVHRHAAGNSTHPSVVAAAANAEPATPQRKIKFYRNPMGLPDTSPTPKLDSMGMDYIPVYEDEQSDDTSVAVSPRKIQRAGVETAPAGRHAVTRTIKAPGVVQLDERRIAVVAPRFDGFVESVKDITTGMHIKKGDPMVTVFGQELLTQGARLIIEQGPGGRGDDLGLPKGGVIGALRRLKNLAVPEDFIEQIRRERKVPDTMTVRAPISGVLLERNIVDGQAFKAGDVAFRIGDHSVVWVMADVAEGDMAAVKEGQSVTVTARAHPGRTFDGKVAVVFPHLVKETRTARVRIELPNPDLALLPDMYADVEIAAGTGEDAVAVPSSAVVDSGSRQVIFIELGEGRFEPRNVKLGRRGDGFVEILSGLTEGEKFVVNGTFLIDAESNLQSALKSFTPPTPAPPVPAPPPSAPMPQEMKP